MILEEQLRDILNNLLPELNRITIAYMAKAGTPSNSDVSKSVQFINTQTGIALEANYYFKYDSAGRRRGVRKVPITALIDFIKSRGIAPRNGQTITQMAFAMQTAIYRNGISPKNYFDKIVNATSDVTEEMVANDLAEDIADDVMAILLKAPQAIQTT